MRKFGLIAAIVGFGILAAGLLLRLLANSPVYLALDARRRSVRGRQRPFLLVPLGKPAAGRAHAQCRRPLGTDTARLLDNFEQRFAELKGRKPNATVLGDLYTLGNQLEQRGRIAAGHRGLPAPGDASTTPTAMSPRACAA